MKIKTMAKLKNHRQIRQKLIFGNPVWKALSFGPLSETEQIDVALVTHSAFDDIVRGVGAKEQLMALMTACSLASLLANRGYGHEFQNVIRNANSALVRCGLAQELSRKYELDDQGVKAIRDLLILQGEQIRLASRAEVVTAIATVNEQIRDSARRKLPARL
jgi:hypothetical protein